MRLVIGDALHSLGDLGSGALRLDANGFLGVEKSTEGEAAWSEGHPLSEAANQLIASMVRKVGGFTFQELNLTIDDIRNGSERGADLSYDFVNRPAYHHALATGDTEFLRLTLKLSRAAGCRAGVAGARAAEPRRDDVRAGALRRRAQGRRVRLPRRAADRRPAGGDDPPGSDRPASPATTGPTTPPSPRTGSPPPPRRSSPPRSATPTCPELSEDDVERSSRRICCWRCSTPGSPACSPCPAGTCAGC